MTRAHALAKARLIPTLFVIPEIEELVNDIYDSFNTNHLIAADNFDTVKVSEFNLSVVTYTGHTKTFTRPSGDGLVTLLIGTKSHGS